MSRCVLFTLTPLGRGDVLALLSCVLEQGEGSNCFRVMCAEDSSVGSHHILK